MARIYCAGPLFNEPEKREMAAIAAQLESAGHETFLPQRDGIELSEVGRELDALQMDSTDVTDLLHRAIFCLDVYKLLGWSQAVVANLNGRVPDEGTVVEAALAWHAQMPIVLYKNDARAPFRGDDNPMLTCLADLRTVADIPRIPQALRDELATDTSNRVKETLGLGEQIARASETEADPRSLTEKLVGLMGNGRGIHGRGIHGRGIHGRGI